MIDFVSTNLWSVWLGICVLCLIIELSSGDFYVTCFAIGAACAMVPALVGSPLWVQCVVWVVCSVLSIALIRPSLIKHFHKGGDERTSNADALIGRKGTVSQTIPADGHGYVKIDGDEWRSVSKDKEEIAVGTKVNVVDRESIVLTVEKAN